MANVTLTARELKNKNTGIDIYVPKYDTIPGPLGGTVMYNIIVVTRLFYFKTKGKYKESDVVQFMNKENSTIIIPRDADMVPHKFATFEDLYHKLLQKFSSVVFTSLPKKALIVNDIVLNERRRVMEDVLQQIAKTPKLACSSSMLEFLGVEQTSVTKMDEKDSSQEPLESKTETEDTAEDIDLFASDKQTDHDSRQGEEQKEEVDLEEKDDFLSLTKSSSSKPLNQRSIFDVGKDDNDDDIGDLFIPAGAVQKRHVVMETENNSDLLNIEDDLDKLLVSNKPSKPALPKKPVPKPRIKPKPQLKPKPAAKPQFEDTTGNDELFKSSDDVTAKSKVEELFAPRKGSLRKPSHDEESLDDIFKSSATKPVFPAADDDDDDDLFKTSSSSSKKLADMDVDDISSYIQQNTEQKDDNLDLF